MFRLYGKFRVHRARAKSSERRCIFESFGRLTRFGFKLVIDDTINKLLNMNVLEPTTLTRAAEFRKKLESKIVVADGAMGTMLYAKGIFINRCFDELNLSAPQLVKEIHQEYVSAGAEVIETNTLAAIGSV